MRSVAWKWGDISGHNTHMISTAADTIADTNRYEKTKKGYVEDMAIIQ